jgi:hypothetical protein
LRVTAAVHRFINCVKQYEKCDPPPLEDAACSAVRLNNPEPDNLSNYVIQASQLALEMSLYWCQIEGLRIQLPPLKGSKYVNE